MYKYINNVVSKQTGQPIQNATIFVQTYPNNGVATIYSDDGVTPVPGQTVITNQFGEYFFYANPGRYNLTISIPNSSTVPVTYTVAYRELDIAIESSLIELAPSTGAALVGSVGPSNVQMDINNRPTSNTLAASTGATLIGSSGPSTVQADITARPTSSQLAGPTGSSLVGFLQAGTGAVARTVQDKERDIVSPKDFGAVGDGTATDTADIQHMLDAYALQLLSYTPTSPNVSLLSGPILEIPNGVYSVGNLSFTGSVLRMRSQGAIFKFSAGSTGITINSVGILDIEGLTFTGGANHITASNNNLDGTLFSISECSFHDSSDWPVIFKPVTPSGSYSVNHLSGLGVIKDSRWYNTNGCVKHYFDKFVVKDSYATLYGPTQTNGKWAANRSAFENRSLGDGILLDNFFGVAIANNGSNGNVWVDNYPGDNGVVPVDNTNYIGSTSSVSEGGGVYIRNSRLGSESGGVPAIRNYCHSLGGLSALGRVHLLIDGCGSMAGGNGGTNTALIILKKGLPSSITIRGGTGVVGSPLIDDSQIVDLSNAASNVDYWLNAARNGQGRISINIEGRNRALAGATVVPTSLIPFSLYDSTETNPRTLAFGGLLDLSVGTTSGQIKFPSTQNPSSNANTLDDYSEGTWVPVDASGAGLSLTVSAAEYVKVGQIVTVSAIITFPVTANGAGVMIGGLPFVSKASADWVYGGSPSYTNLGTAFTLLVQAGASVITAYDLSGAAKTNANFSTKSMRFGITYRTAA